jgi:hypothetical protein
VYPEITALAKMASSGASSSVPPRSARSPSTCAEACASVCCDRRCDVGHSSW